MYLACPRDNAFLKVHVAIVHVHTMSMFTSKKTTDSDTNKIELNVVSKGRNEKDKENGSKLFQSRSFLFIYFKCILKTLY